ncbi:hypothetical protein VTN02DRAFT_854 [Thermoascus thermophilus]
MAGPQNREDSWGALSAVFSKLELSLSRDSCYASDELPAPPAVATAAATPDLSPVSAAQLSLAPVPVLKSILKKPCTELEAEDTESESGYESDGSEPRYDASSDCDISASQDFDGEDLFDDDDDDNASDASLEYTTSDVMTESHGEGDEFDFDDSFITFESSVRFNSEVRYIDAPDFYDEEDNSTSEMTVHEMMELARASGSLTILQKAIDNEPNDSSAHESRSEEDYSSADGDIMGGPEEHTRDDVELDKQLFIAYMNGINGVPDNKYKPHLRTRANEIRLGRAQSPFLESETVYGTYLDHVLNHVIGSFRSLVERDEFDELVRLSERKAAMEQLESSPEIIEAHTKKLLKRIEDLLSERLAQGNVEVGEDELSFFAGGVAHALENRSIYTHN